MSGNLKAPNPYNTTYHKRQLAITTEGGWVGEERKQIKKIKMGSQMNGHFVAWNLCGKRTHTCVCMYVRVVKTIALKWVRGTYIVAAMKQAINN